METMLVSNRNIGILSAKSLPKRRLPVAHNRVPIASANSVSLFVGESPSPGEPTCLNYDSFFTTPRHALRLIRKARSISRENSDPAPYKV
jgi:hypothetical protein